MLASSLYMYWATWAMLSSLAMGLLVQTPCARPVCSTPRMESKLQMVATTSQSRQTRAELRSETFQQNGLDVEFGSVQHVEAPIPGAALASLENYLQSDPARIVYACWDNDMIDDLGDGKFRLHLKEKAFLSLSLTMSIVIRLWSEGPKVMARSEGWSAQELERVFGRTFADNFRLDVQGQLTAREEEVGVRSLRFKSVLLDGDVGITIGGKLPGLLRLTPGAILKSAALGVNKQVLQYVSDIFVQSVAADYREWVREQEARQTEVSQ